MQFLFTYSKQLSTVSLLSLTVKNILTYCLLCCLIHLYLESGMEREFAVWHLQVAGSFEALTAPREILAYKLVLISNLPCSKHIRYSSQRSPIEPKVLNFFWVWNLASKTRILQRFKINLVFLFQVKLPLPPARKF